MGILSLLSIGKEPVQSPQLARQGTAWTPASDIHQLVPWGVQGGVPQLQKAKKCSDLSWVQRFQVGCTAVMLWLINARGSTWVFFIDLCE